MILYRIKAGRWTSKQRRSFNEAEKLKKRLSGCITNIEIIAERVRG